MMGDNIFGRWGEEHEGRKEERKERVKKKEAKINLCDTETETEKRKI